MEARTAGECSRTRGGLTLPTSSDSGIEQNNTQDAGMLPVGKVHDMSNIIRTNDSKTAKLDVKKKENIVVEVSEIFADDFWELKTKKDAIKWIDSVPRKYEKSILATLAFDYINRIR